MNSLNQRWTRETFLGEVSAVDLSLHEHFLNWADRYGEVKFGEGSSKATWQLWLTNSDGSKFYPFLVYADSKISIGYQKMPENMPLPIQTWYKELVSRADGIVQEEATQKQWFLIDLTLGGNAILLVNCVERMQIELKTTENQ